MVLHIAHVYSKKHMALSMAGTGIEAPSYTVSGHVVHTLFVARYDELWVLLQHRTIVSHRVTAVLLPQFITLPIHSIFLQLT